MDQINDLLTLKGAVAAIYYGIIALVTVFSCGWFLNSRLKKMFAENNAYLEAEVSQLRSKVEKLESEKVHTHTYETGMKNVLDLINEVRKEIRDNFNSLSGRMDMLLLNQK